VQIEAAFLRFADFTGLTASHDSFFTGLENCLTVSAFEETAG
jgi:hypothetical protein